MRRWFTTATIVAAVTVVALWGGQASAVPIVYEGQVQPNVTSFGVNTQPIASQSDPVGANYFFFTANAGAVVNIFGDRLAGHYDMSFWIFSGLFNDTNQFGASFDAGDPGFIAFGDDQDPPNIPGPFGDPNVTFVAPITGSYTIAVTNFFSSAGPPNPFSLNGSGITPEPASLAIFGLMGLAGVGYAWRRRKAAV